MVVSEFENVRLLPALHVSRGSKETMMTKLYVFQGTCGKAQMVTDDKSGNKLPPHAFGKWVFSKTTNIEVGTRLVGAADATQLLANIAKDGYHHWPELEPEF